MAPKPSPTAPKRPTAAKRALKAADIENDSVSVSNSKKQTREASPPQKLTDEQQPVVPRAGIATASTGLKKRVAPASQPAVAGQPSQRRLAFGSVDALLKQYRSMRDFSLTAEPSGTSQGARAASLPFVIQKHAATRLHYDFRLGWAGVLKSWAVAKGPSYCTKDKRLAVEVEDHPIEYGGFEGTIPKGQYGGGTVMVWDHGTWEPISPDVDQALAKGELKFTLHGTRLSGSWVLVRMAPRRDGKYGNSTRNNWLLIKERDGTERSCELPPITETEPDSVITGRSLEAIACDEDHTWNSATKDPAKALQRHPAPRASRTAPAPISEKETSQGTKRKHASAAPSVAPWAQAIASLPREFEPDFLAPQLATQAQVPPSGSGWLHELKLDGYRIQAHVTRSQQARLDTKLITRSGLDWTHRMPVLAQFLTELLLPQPVTSAVFDGEMVVVDQDGTTSFALLQAAFQPRGKGPAPKQQQLTYFVFDLLHLNGHNLRGLPLQERKSILAQIISGHGSIQFSDHIETSGDQMYAQACRLGAEGIVSKRADSTYSGGRSASWLKLKCGLRQEFVIGGFTLLSNGSPGVGALLLGYYSDEKLMYAGRTGTGFTQSLHTTVRAQLDCHLRATSPFSQPLPAEARRGAHWVDPVLVAEVAFSSWTADSLVRQAAFKGLRIDKPAKEVVRELPEWSPRSTSHASAAVRATQVGKAAALTKVLPAAPTPSKGTKKRGTKSERKETVEDTNGDAKNTSPPAVASLSQAPVRLTHPDKLLDESSHTTKRLLADYYWAVSQVMLPHLAGRPISLVRCPQGSGHPCFFQKHNNRMLPPGIGSVQVPGKHGEPAEDYITFDTPEDLAGLAQISVLEIHPWGSLNSSLEQPDRVIFDLDPDESISWPTLTAAAFEVRDRLKQAGLQSFVKTTGGKGLHIVAPILPDHPWPVMKQFTRELAAAMEADNPSLYLIRMTKAARKGKIYVDYQRNERGATAVAPWSPRARPGMPVAVPLNWQELKQESAPHFAVAQFSSWSSRLSHDPWKPMLSLGQSIPDSVIKALKPVS